MSNYEFSDACLEKFLTGAYARGISKEDALDYLHQREKDRLERGSFHSSFMASYRTADKLASALLSTIRPGHARKQLILDELYENHIVGCSEKIATISRYSFGYIEGVILVWTGTLMQLAWAIHEAKEALPFKGLTPYRLVKELEKRGTIQINGQWESVKKYLEQMQHKGCDLERDKSVFEAAEIIKSLFPKSP